MLNASSNPFQGGKRPLIVERRFSGAKTPPILSNDENSCIHAFQLRLSTEGFLPNQFQHGFQLSTFEFFQLRLYFCFFFLNILASFEVALSGLTGGVYQFQAVLIFYEPSDWALELQARFCKNAWIVVVVVVVVIT